MAEREGKFEPLGRRSLHYMKVRVAGACAPDLYQDLPRPRLGNRYFTQLGRLLKFD
jgi:hypothetical protein